MLNVAKHLRSRGTDWQSVPQGRAGWADGPSDSPGTGRRPIPRRGLTLIELLVVVSVMMVLVVVTVPRMRPAMEERRIREAARAINVYLSAARSRAIESGRPWGVAIVRDGNLPLAGSKLIQVEVPPPYAGDYEASTIIVTPTGGPTCNVAFPMGENPVVDGLVKTGDVLKLNFQGHEWRIHIPDPENAPNVWALMSQTTPNPPDTGGNGVRFQVFRQPLTSSVEPLRLPRNVVIDLWYSGTSTLWFADTATTVTRTPYPTIMFSSTGSVSQVAADTIGTVPATEPVFLLVGRRDRVNPDPMQGDDATRAIPAVAEDGRTNLADLTNLWVAINPQTGYIVCAENSAGANINEIRQYAREFQAMGGR